MAYRATRLSRCACALLPIVSIFGCADATRIRTIPGGARVFVNAKPVCTTPTTGDFCLYTAPRSEFSEHTPIRIELEGYQTIEDELETATLKSRIVGGFFTFGLVPLCKRPHTYVTRHEYTMKPSTAANRGAGLKTQAAPAPIATRLREARALHEKGLISSDEYDRIRRSILGDL